MASASSAVDIGFVPQGHHSKEKAEEWATKREQRTQKKEHIVFDRDIWKSQLRNCENKERDRWWTIWKHQYVLFLKSSKTNKYAMLGLQKHLELWKFGRKIFLLNVGRMRLGLGSLRKFCCWGPMFKKTPCVFMHESLNTLKSITWPCNKGILDREIGRWKSESKIN